MTFRVPFTHHDAALRGISIGELRWQVSTGLCRRVAHGAYVEGPAAPTDVERALAVCVATNGIASHTLAGLLHELDGVELKPPFATVLNRTRSAREGTRCRVLPEEGVTVVQGVPCTTGLQTILDLAAVLDDLRWEQALESALRKRLTSIEEITAALPSLSKARAPGVACVRRVLELRPDGAPPTESLLETLMVQLIRAEPQLPTPTRQVEVFNQYGTFVARVDLAWPEHGVFIELDGQHHLDQPVHDARRETAVVATTGWLPGRFTWHEVTRTPKATARRLVELLQAAVR